MAGPSEGRPTHGSNPFDMLGAFVPWIVYWILVGNVSFRLAVTIAFVLTIAISAYSVIRGQSLKVLEIGGNLIFLALLVVTFTTNDQFLEQWIQPLTNGGLLAITLVSVLVGRPFTVQYAREQVSAEVAAMPGFLFVNKVITWVWIAAFAVMTAASLVPPAVQGDATIRDADSTLAILGYWVVPFIALGLAALFSQRFPDWFTASIGREHGDDGSRSPRPGGQPIATVDRPRLGAVEQHAGPERALIDEPLVLSLTGAPAGSEVAFYATTLDAFGRRWQSQARFAAGADGAVDLTSQAPTSGSYDGIDAMGLVWSMQPADGGMPDLFVSLLDLTALQISAEVPGEGTVGITLAREAIGEDVARSHLDKHIGQGAFA